MTFTIGQVFGLSIQRDVLLRIGRLELHWQGGEGFTYQRVSEGYSLSSL